MFYFFSDTAALYPPAASADRRENLTRDWKCMHLDNASPKIGASPRKNFGGNWLRGEISELPRSIAVKLYQMTGNRESFIS